MTRLFSTLALLLLAVAASNASLLRPSEVHLVIGVDDWLDSAPWKVGAESRSCGQNASMVAEVDASAPRKVGATFGIPTNYSIPYGNNQFGSVDGSYIMVPICFGHPYRLMYVRDGLGLLREVISENDPPKAMLFEETFTALRIAPNANYTGLYKGPVKAGDILAAGIYTITQKPLIPIGKPTVIEIYMQSAVPGSSTGPVVNENFKVYSPQYGSGIAVIQIITGDEVNSKGQRHYHVRNNFFFPAPEGISTIPPVTTK